MSPLATPEAGLPASSGQRADPAALDDALDLLYELAEQSSEATAGLARLRQAHPEHTFHLLSDREGYDGSVHHDLVVRRPGAPAVSLSVAAPSGLPWPLRGVQRARDSELLEVNGRSIGVAEAMARIDLLTDRAAMRLLVDGCLLAAELERDPVSLDEAELQAAADAFRRGKGLTGAAQTRQWLGDRGLTPRDFAELVTRQAEFEALRRRRTDAEVECWLDEHGADLDELVLAWTDVDTAHPASAEGDLRARPAEAVLSAVLAGRRAGIVRRPAIELGPDAAGAAPGELIELDLGGGPAVALVLERRSLQQGRRREQARDQILRAQLAAERRAARITWFWGKDGETP